MKHSGVFSIYGERFLLGLIALVVSLCFGLPLSASGADKLIIKDSGGTTTKFVARDDGSIGVNNPTALGYVLDVSAGDATGVALSHTQLHFSSDGADGGGWISAVGSNSIYLSSGAAVSDGHWVQKSSDGKSAIFAVDGSGIRLFTQQGNTQGQQASISTRLKIDYSGNMGIGMGVNPVLSYPLQVGSTNTNGNGAYLSAGGVWTNGSSREFKENIEPLSAEKALDTVRNLNPVTYAYKVDPNEKHVGFIAEDVPDIVAMSDRKHLSPMDIVAVLTKVVQEQQKTISELSRKMESLQKELRLKNGFAALDAR